LSEVKAACRLIKFVFSRLLQDGAGSRLHFLHSFNSGFYHHSPMEIILQCVRLSVSISLQTNIITVNTINQRNTYGHRCLQKQRRSFNAVTMINGL